MRTKLLARQDAQVLVQGWQRGVDERQCFFVNIDGRNAAPVDMENLLFFIGFHV